VEYSKLGISNSANYPIMISILLVQTVF